MKFINMTPHSVTVANTTFPPCGEVARIVPPAPVIAQLGDFEVAEFPPVGNSEAAETAAQILDCVRKHAVWNDSTFAVIVSGLVLDTVKRMVDDGIVIHLLAPDTGPDSVLRDAEGRVTGVRRFRR